MINSIPALEPLNAIPRQAEGLHIAAQMISHPEFAGREITVSVDMGCIRLMVNDRETVEIIASLLGTGVNDTHVVSGARQHLTAGWYCSYPVRAYWFQELTVVTG